MKIFLNSFALMKFAFLSFFLMLSVAACQTASSSRLETSLAVSPTVTPKIDDSINRPVSEPYRGALSIFEDENRAQNLQIDRVMDILKIQDGKSVADIGAGSGWFTVRAAKRVGDAGKVFAVEINQEYVDHINDRAKKENFSNVQTILGTEDNPKLPPDSVDAVLILKTYHEIGQPVKVLENLRKALRKDARIGVIDKNGRGDDHGIAKETVIGEFKRAGFVLMEDYDFVKPDGMDYFLIFQVK
jgi:SAM-dependent methyltransferase